MTQNHMNVQDAKRMVIIPFNEHSAVAVHAYLAKDPDFSEYAAHVNKEPEEIFSIDEKSGTLKKTVIKYNGAAFSSLHAGEDIPHWSLVYAEKHPDAHVEAVTTTDFWLDRLYSDEWTSIRKCAFGGRKDIDPREIIEKLIRDGEYSFKINGYMIRWEVLEKDYPNEVAKFVILGPRESSLEDYRKLHKITHLSEKRLANFGRRAVELTFPGQEIETETVTRSTERLARFLIYNNEPMVTTDLIQKRKSAKEAGLVVFADFCIQPLIASTVKNGNGSV